MAAEMKVILVGSLTGLGKTEEFPEAFTTTTTPSAKTKIYQAQTTTDVAEALNIGDVTTVHLIVIKAVSKAVNIDPSYTSATFRAGINLQEGEVAVFKPSGSVYLKNVTTSETFTVEALVVGV